MGRNTGTVKMRQRKSQNKFKARQKRAVAAGKAAAAEAHKTAKHAAK